VSLHHNCICFYIFNL